MSENVQGNAATAAEAVVAEVPKEETREFITIPTENLHEEAYPEIGINAMRFSAGKTYEVTSEIAGEIRRIIKAHNAECVRRMRRGPDRKSLKQATGSEANQLNFT